MKKIVTIIGARPQIIKSAAISRVIKTQFSDNIKEVLVHTGQHYSDSLSTIFFQELGLKFPDYNLKIGSDSHALQTAKIMEHLERVLIEEQPDAIVIYGDTNSTVAAALTASKLFIPVIHIEAGLRSFNKKMPEEINRIMSDHVSTLLFSPTEQGVENLKKEGFNVDAVAPFTIDNPKVYHCGDIMYDNHLYYSEKLKEDLPPYELLSLQSQSFFLGTIHRPENTDNPENLKSIFEAFLTLAEIYPKHLIYLPLHPRTQRAINLTFDEEFRTKVEECSNIRMIPPVSFMNMIALQQYCDLVITDSGGLQKEAYFAKKLSVILRNETEWVEILDQGAGITTGADKDRIIDGVKACMETIKLGEVDFAPLYGDGKAAEFIVKEILENS